MDNTLLIWKYLKPLLTQNQELTKYINAAYMYPCAAVLTDTHYPFLIYRRESITPEYTKHIPNASGWVNNISISVTVVSDNYDESAYIANLVRNILENARIRNDEIKIMDIELASSYESYNDDAYQQNLIFNLTAV